MRIVAFITEPSTLRAILALLGQPGRRCPLALAEARTDFESNHYAERMRYNASMKKALSDGFLVIRAPKASAGTCVICS